MKSNSHIAFVTPGFAENEADTLCTPYLQSYFRALHAARPDLRISIIALQYPYRKARYNWHGLDVIALGGHNRRWKKPLIWQQCRQMLTRLHREQPLELVHAYWLGEAVACAIRFGKRSGVPVFATIMGQDALPTNRYLQRLEFAACTTIALSPFSAKLFATNAGCNADSIIPFGLADEDVVATVSTERPIDILGVGSLIAAKRPDRFLRVVSRLAEQFPQLRAVLVGDGPEKARLERLIQEAGMGAHLQLLPTMGRPELLQTMRRAKVFLHTSQIEGMGMVLAEALANGCHLVSTPVGVAEFGEKCLLAADTFTLGEHVAHFLKYPVDWAPRHAYDVADTLRRHIELYGWK